MCCSKHIGKFNIPNVEEKSFRFSERFNYFCYNNSILNLPRNGCVLFG